MNEPSIQAGGFLSVRMLIVLLTCTTVVSWVNVAEANIVWEWSFQDQPRPPGIEAGRFLTDGNLIGGAAPAATYHVLDFEVTLSDYGNPIGSLLGGQYNEGSQPGTGFDWDGAFDTQWFRDGGTYTNGASYFVTTRSGDPGRYSFDVRNYYVEGGPTSTVLSLAPIPEPATLSLLALGGLALLRRRRVG